MAESKRNNSWLEWSKYVLKQLEQLTVNQKEMYVMMDKIRVEVAKISTKPHECNFNAGERLQKVEQEQVGINSTLEVWGLRGKGGGILGAIVLVVAGAMKLFGVI